MRNFLHQDFVEQGGKRGEDGTALNDYVAWSRYYKASAVLKPCEVEIPNCSISQPCTQTDLFRKARVKRNDISESSTIEKNGVGLEAPSIIRAGG
jgi:hypothetical protein